MSSRSNFSDDCMWTDFNPPQSKRWREKCRAIGRSPLLIEVVLLCFDFKAGFFAATQQPLNKSWIHGFFAALFALIAPHRFERLAEYRNSKRGRPPKLPLPDLLAALLFHFLCGAGTASEHLFQLLGRRLGESGITERRSVLPWALWERFLRDAWRATAHRRRPPEAFSRGWRLVAIEGTQFSVSNTPQTRRVLRPLVVREIWAQGQRQGWRSEPVR